MQILNQLTKPTTTTIQQLTTLAIFLREDPEITSTCSDQLAYWLYNKDVPIPTIPKMISSRISGNRQRWKSGGMHKTPPVVDKGWNKEKD